jgi:hypothetical protein
MEDSYSEDPSALQTASEDELVQKLQKLADMKQFRLKVRASCCGASALSVVHAGFMFTPAC